MRKANEIFNVSEGVDFTDDERELLADSLGKFRALLGRVDRRLGRRNG